MDKSLKFFTSLYKKDHEVKKDPITGLPLTNIEGNVIINYYDKTDPTKKVRTENKKYSFEAGTENGEVLNYLGNSPINELTGIPVNPEEDSDIRLSSIIKWTQETNKKLYLEPKHFVSLKNFNTYPANRLMILRRFSGAAPHNLFNTKSNIKPIATLVGYYDFDNLPMKISFNEKWKQFDSNLLSVVQDVIGIKFESIPGIGDLFSKASSSPFGQDLLYTIANKLNFVSDGISMPYGDPNLIHDAAIRDVSGEGLATGLESEVSIEFETTFVMNEELGSDGRVNMLNLISEVHKMGTSNGRFVAGNSAALKTFFKGLENGDISQLTDAFSTAITEVVETCKKLITDDPKPSVDANGKSTLSESDALSAIGAKASSFVDKFLSLGQDLVKARFSRYRWKIKGAVGALSGAHTAPWHISLGNPKHPWFVCGNMILETCEIIPGGELMYNDMFSEFTVKIKLKGGRVMHKGELESLFNSGTGRIYDKPEKVLTYNVVDGTQVIVPADGGEITVNSSNSNNDFSQTRSTDPAQNS